MGLGTSSLSRTLLSAPRTGSTDSFCSMPSAHGGILPVLPPHSGARGVSALQGRTELRLEMVTTDNPKVRKR